MRSVNAFSLLSNRVSSILCPWLKLVGSFVVTRVSPRYVHNSTVQMNAKITSSRLDDEQSIFAFIEICMVQMVIRRSRSAARSDRAAIYGVVKNPAGSVLRPLGGSVKVRMGPARGSSDKNFRLCPSTDGRPYLLGFEKFLTGVTGGTVLSRDKKIGLQYGLVWEIRMLF